MAPRRPWQLDVTGKRTRTFESEVAALGPAVLAAYEQDWGHHVILRNTETKAVYSLTHEPGHRLRISRSGVKGEK